MARPRTARIETEEAQLRPAARACDHPGCARGGEFRAPRNRKNLNEYYWFCLEHVRAYNAAWDFYRGMSTEEIERSRRQDTVGWRPTWPLGSRMSSHRVKPEDVMRAFRRAFADLDGEEIGTERARAPRPAATGPEAEARAVLDIDDSASFAQIKARYRELVKRHHPDANGGDKDAEERLKSINQAYHTLKAAAAGG